VRRDEVDEHVGQHRRADERVPRNSELVDVSCREGRKEGRKERKREERE